jgi:hypothetical protein
VACFDEFGNFDFQRVPRDMHATFKRAADSLETFSGLGTQLLT